MRPEVGRVEPVSPAGGGSGSSEKLTDPGKLAEADDKTTSSLLGRVRDGLARLLGRKPKPRPEESNIARESVEQQRNSPYQMRHERGQGEHGVEQDRYTLEPATWSERGEASTEKVNSPVVEKRIIPDSPELRALKERHPSNVLFKDELEVPEGMTTVVRIIHEDFLESVGDQGALPQERHDPIAPNIEDLFDERAPAGISRKSSVFVHPDEESIKSRMSEGNIMIEMVVDPRTAAVVDAEQFTEAKGRLWEGQDAQPWINGYWDSRMSLADYQKLTPQERDDRFIFPEVLIPGGVSPDRIRVKKVLPPEAA